LASRLEHAVTDAAVERYMGDERRGASCPLSLENAGAFDAEVSVVLPNPLASVRGHIAADQVVFSPNPKSVSASGAAEVRVQVNVPTSAAPGSYLGIVRFDKIPGRVLILEVEVA
jgi:hypothetical protein